MADPAPAVTVAPSTTDASLFPGIRSILELLGGNQWTEGQLAVAVKLASAAAALVLIIVTYFVAKLMGRWVAAAMCKKVDETLGKFAGRFTFYGVLVCGSLSILGSAGVNVASVAALLTAAGFAIGLAFQGTLSNFAAGILLLVFRPFKVGDMVVVSGVAGKVNEIDLFTTTLDTTDNRRLIVPNSAIAGSTIENVTFHAHRRVEVPVGVAYSSNLDQTRHVLTEAAEAVRPLLIDGEGRGYQILLTNLGSSSVDWVVRFWTATPNFFAARESLTREIKMRLDQAEISIPFPQMHLHFDPPATTTAHHEPVASAPVPHAGRVHPRLRNPWSDAA